MNKLIAIFLSLFGLNKKVIEINEAETTFPPVLPSIEVEMIQEEIEVFETVTLPEGFQPRNTK